MEYMEWCVFTKQSDGFKSLKKYIPVENRENWDQ